MAVAGKELELQSAVSSRKRKSTPELSWLFKQCSVTDLFNLYDGNKEESFLERQTYRQWKSLIEFQRVVHPRRLRQKIIVLQPITHKSFSSSYSLDKIDTTVIKHLQNFCEGYFLNMDIVVATPIDLSEVRQLTSRVHTETQREQILVGDILKHLKHHRPSSAYCMAGMTLVDLYPSPEWNFVLGHASLTNGCAVISFGRYFNSQVTGSSFDQMLNLWVLIRVMTHEICHTFGMKHCYYFKCAMNDSSSIEEAAMQPLFLCPVCLRKLQKALKFSILERYKRLLYLCRELHSEVLQSREGVERSKNDVNIEAGERSENMQLEVNQSDPPLHPSEVNQSDPPLHPSKVNQSDPPLHPSELNQSVAPLHPSEVNQSDPSLHASEVNQSDPPPRSPDTGCHQPNRGHLQQFQESIHWLERSVSALAQFMEQCPIKKKRAGVKP